MKLLPAPIKTVKKPSRASAIISLLAIFTLLSGILITCVVLALPLTGNANQQPATKRTPRNEWRLSTSGTAGVSNDSVKYYRVNWERDYIEQVKTGDSNNFVGIVHVKPKPIILPMDEGEKIDQDDQWGLLLLATETAKSFKK